MVVVGQWGSRAALGQAVPMMPRGATRGLLLALLCGPVSAATMMWDLVPFVSDQTIEMKVNGDSLSGIAEEYVAVRRIDTGFSLCPPPPVCVYYAGNASVALCSPQGAGGGGCSRCGAMCRAGYWHGHHRTSANLVSNTRPCLTPNMAA